MFVVFCSNKLTNVKSFENTTHHVYSRLIIVHHVLFGIHKREVLGIGFTKGMAAFGGGIIFIFFRFFGRIFENFMKTQHIMSLISSCLIKIRWTSPNLIQKGGSKYRVHQGYGWVWRRYPFCIFCIFFAEKYCNQNQDLIFFKLKFWIETSCHQHQDRAKSWKKQFLNTFSIEFWIETSCHQNQDRAKS